MLKTLQWIFDRLAERVVSIVAASFTSVIESVLAQGRAEQQSRLEDAARKYEEEGKPEIAATLRSQVTRLSSSNPAAQAIELQEQLASDQARIGQGEAPANDAALEGLPDFSSGGSRSRRKKRQKRSDDQKDSQE